MFRPFALTCNPLSLVSRIGFSPLNFNATVKMLLSGERLSKSLGNNDKSDSSILTLDLSIALLM